MNLQQRLEILVQLGEYISAQPESWQITKQTAMQKNNWFTQDFMDLATANIVNAFLQKEELSNWAKHYHIDDNVTAKKVGLIMAGNIPLVGFHDFVSVFVSGHKQLIKPSSKDDVLLKHLVSKMVEWNSSVSDYVQFAERLNDCDAYIATGSNNSARYFEYYFGRYPSIIRKNRTSIAILTGYESEKELELLADDIMQFFGLGCRNVTQVYVPEGYDFIPLLTALKKYKWFFDHHKYRNNYDYQLAIYLMNNQYYMTNDCVVLVENKNAFSPIGTLHYQFYSNAADVFTMLKGDETIQTIVGSEKLPFGKAQSPGLMDYADGVDVMEFLLGL